METRPPTVTRILVAIGFALSCFALALFLWIAFGGPLPLKPEGYRFTVPFKEATQLAAESDVRISGVSVGKVKSISLGDNGLADATIEMDSQYAPIPDDTRAILRPKTLLGETYVELTPGSRSAPTLPEGGTLPTAQVSQAVAARRDLPYLQRPHPRGVQGLDAGGRGRAQPSRRRPLGRDRRARSVRPGDQPRPADPLQPASGGAASVPQRGRRLPGALGAPGPAPRADPELQRRLPDDRAPQRRTSRSSSRSCPTFLRESRATLDRLNSFAENTDPLVRQLQPAAKQLSPTLIAAGKAAPHLQRFFDGLRGTIDAAHAGFPALRRLLADDFTPLLARLGTSVGGRSPFLAEFNPIIEVLHSYRHEITAFLANAAASDAIRPARAGGERQQRRPPPDDEPAQPREPRLVPAAADVEPGQPLHQAARLQQPPARPRDLRQHAVLAPGSTPRCRRRRRWPTTRPSTAAVRRRRPDERHRLLQPAEGVRVLRQAEHHDPARARRATSRATSSPSAARRSPIRTSRCGETSSRQAPARPGVR